VRFGGRAGMVVIDAFVCLPLSGGTVGTRRDQ